MSFHHFTVDVEEYFQVSALEPFVMRADWDRTPSRVAGATHRVLDLMDDYGARGTFFVLSWIAERHAELVREIVRRGHEVASHGSDHKRVTQLTPQEFRASVRESKRVLEQVCGQDVIGYRAPSFSVVPGREWALDVLLEEGFLYDSSLFPVRRRGYGYPGTDPWPHRLRRPAGELLEFPPATLGLSRQLRWPAGGGAYLRLFPYSLLRGAVAQAERLGYASTIYIHPWEMDPEQPRLRVPLTTRIRHYGGLKRTAPRLHRLFGEFRFRSIRESLALTSAARVLPNRDRG